MADSGALMNNNAAVVLKVFDQGARVIPSSLEYPNALLDSSTGIARVVRRVDTREESDVDAEWFRGEFASLANRFTQSVGRGLRERSEDTCGGRMAFKQMDRLLRRT